MEEKPPGTNCGARQQLLLTGAIDLDGWARYLPCMAEIKRLREIEKKYLALLESADNKKE